MNGDLDYAAVTMMRLIFNYNNSTVDLDTAFWDMPSILDWLFYDVNGTT